MVQVTCEKTGVQFEAATRRTKNHPSIMSILSEASKDGWYDQALKTLKQGREQGFTTLEQFVDALRATEENHKCASNAAYEAEKERQRMWQDARRERATTNAFLRERGYKWVKFENDEEDVDLHDLPEVEFHLFSSDGRNVTVTQAMQELAYADVRYAKEWLAKHSIAEELPAIEKKRQAEEQEREKRMSCQVEIYRNDYSKPVDIEAIHAALKANGIEFDPGDEENMIPCIFTDDTTRAVKIINSLGYSTDEDGIENEDY